MKLFHKIATSLLGATMALGVGFALANSNKELRQARADSATWKASDQNKSNGTEMGAQTIVSGVTMTGDIGSNGSNAPKFYNSSAEVRFYAGNTVTFASTSGNFKSIVFTTSTSLKFTASVGTLDSSGLSWTGDAASVVFTNGNSGQIKVNQVDVEYGASAPAISLNKDSLTLKTNSEPEVITVTPNSAFSATPSIETQNVPEFIQTSVDGLAVTVTPKAAGTGSFKIVATNNTEVAEKTVTVSVSEPFALPIDGDYYITATRDSQKYYLKSNGTSSAPSAVTDVAQATIFTLTKDADDKFTVMTEDDDYLYCGSSNDSVRVGATADKWIFEEGSRETGLYDMKSNTNSRYLSLYNKADFRGYETPTAVNRLENTDLEPATAKVLQSIALSKDDASVKKTYLNGQSASKAGLTVMATYDSGDPVDVTAKATITANPATVSLSTTSISYTATYGGKTSNAVVVSGITVSKFNAIADIYSKTSGAALDVYGYYVGALDNRDIVIMNGDYGIAIYGGSSDIDVTGYVENETILHVTGSLGLYKGLYQITDPVITKVEAAVGDLDTPVVYATQGGETAEYQSRVTTVTGYVTAIKDNSDNPVVGYEWDKSKDIMLTVRVGTKDIPVFYKKAIQAAADGAKIDDSFANSTVITFKGFVGWFNALQIRMTGLIDAKPDYTAEIFAQDLLDQTDAICNGYVEGDNNHDALLAVWNDLASDDKYPSLPAVQKTALHDAQANEGGTVIQQAMARYDHICKAYKLSNFIDRDSAKSGSNSMNSVTMNNNNVVIILVVSSVVTISLVGLFFVMRRRKHQ